MHDIGQIAVPAEILTRPGKLSQNEFTLVKAHPQVAYDILSSIDFGRPDRRGRSCSTTSAWTAPATRRASTATSILLEARILAVADVVEAMSSHRPYRPALGVEAALAEIAAGAGTPVRRRRRRSLPAGLRRGLRLRELGTPARCRRPSSRVHQGCSTPTRQLRRRRARRRGLIALGLIAVLALLAGVAVALGARRAPATRPAGSGGGPSDNRLPPTSASAIAGPESRAAAAGAGRERRRRHARSLGGGLRERQRGGRRARRHRPRAAEG